MSAFTNLSISRKLMTGFFAVIMVLSAMSFTIYQKLAFLEKSTIWKTHTYDVLETMDLAMASMVDQETGVRGYLLSGDEKFLDPYRNGSKIYADTFRKVKELTSDNSAQQGRLDEMGRLEQTWRGEVAEKEIALMLKMETQAQARAMEVAGAGKSLMDGLRTKVAEIKTVERDLLTSRSAAEKDAFALSYLTTVIGAVTSLMVAVLMGFMLTRVIARPILQIRDAMTKLAGGDTSMDVPGLGRKDEVGAMAGAVEVFKSNMIASERLRGEQEQLKVRAEADKQAAMAKLADEFEASVMGVVHTVSLASTQLQTTSESMSATAEETSRQATVVAAASEQASTNVQTVAAAAEELSSSVTEIGRQVTQATRMAAQAVGEADRTNVTIKGLSDAAEKIGTVVQLISDIASQTNLLALNATIEAARAGEAGKGFAVVAAEVKSLANQTGRATDEITAQVAAMQGATSDAVKAIRNIGETIGAIDEVSTTIASAIEEQGAATQEIARNVQQAAAGTNEVSSSISGVTKAAADTGVSSGQVLGAAGELSRNAEVLRAQVDSFIAKVRAA